MKVRADVVDMLRAGHTQAHIMRTLGVCYATVKTARDAIGMPDPGAGRRPQQDPAAAFAARTEPVDGGHMRWTGTRATGGGTVMGLNGQYISGARLAFTLHHGRDPVGRVTAGCDYPGCIAPGHLTDQVMRQRRRAAAAAKRPARLPSDPEAAFWAQAKAVDNGHVEWTGRRDQSGMPILRVSGVRRSAHRMAFVLRYGREPIGNVLPGCGRQGCVAPGHVEDRPMREQLRKQVAALLGGTT
ncbi:hypothetical protein ABZ508_02755 [Streptomyces lavendulocolor]|uniref:HNH endonuclease n=1 Tax=Streptomyces lavendulocolor TaxID=67316 RepID=A0ABV2VYC3_9ACTN